MTWTDFEDFLKGNPRFKQVISFATPTNYRGTGTPKVPEDFKSILKKIKKDNPRSTINVG